MTLLMRVASRGNTEGPAFKSFEFPSHISDYMSDTKTVTLGGGQMDPGVVTLCVSEGLENNVGLKNWPGGFRMAEYICAFPSLFNGRCILELGAGVGLTAGVLGQVMKSGSLVCTDYDLKTLLNLKRNLRRNGLQTSFGNAFLSLWDGEDEENEVVDFNMVCNGVTCVVDRLDWLNVTSDQLNSYSVDTVITCDTIYLPECLDALCGVLKRLLDVESPQAPPQVFSMQAVRNEEIFSQFESSLRSHGLAFSEVPDLECAPELFEYDKRMFYRIVLYKIYIPSTTLLRCTFEEETVNVLAKSL
jgi:predicted nicotinamide N-methyase